MVKKKMSKELKKAHINFALKMLGRDGAVSFLLSIPTIFWRLEIGLILLFYASLKYNINWIHDDIKCRIEGKY